MAALPGPGVSLACLGLGHSWGALAAWPGIWSWHSLSFNPWQAPFGPDYSSCSSVLAWGGPGGGEADGPSSLGETPGPVLKT